MPFKDSKFAISHGGFARDAAIVMLGTVVAQILPLLFYPIFTRIYSPADFGTFATIAMIATPLAIIASGTYEQAFLVARTERGVLSLFTFIILRSLLVLGGALAVLSIFHASIAAVMGDPALELTLLLVPLISFGQIVYNCTSEWLVRRKAFQPLAINRISQSGLLSLPKLGLGISALTPSGLVIGEALGRVIYMLYSGWRIWLKPFVTYRSNSLRRAIAGGRRFRNFPRVMVPDQLVNTFGGSVHILLIGYAFGPTELGFVSLIFSALYLPVTVVSSSIKDVFRQRANAEYVQSGNCRPIYVKLLAPIVLLGILGFGVLFIISPWIFTRVFGDDWARVGDYARILIPMFFFNFVSMSLGGVLVIADRIAVSLRWQVISLGLAIAALLFGTLILKSVAGTLLVFTIARSLSYAHYMLLSYRYAKLEAA